MDADANLANPTLTLVISKVLYTLCKNVPPLRMMTDEHIVRVIRRMDVHEPWRRHIIVSEDTSDAVERVRRDLAEFEEVFGFNVECPAPEPERHCLREVARNSIVTLIAEPISHHDA